MCNMCILVIDFLGSGKKKTDKNINASHAKPAAVLIFN